MKKVLAVIGGVALVAGLACLVIYCIAVAKDMTFADFIKSWFEKTEEVVDGAENVANVLASMKIGG